MSTWIPSLTTPALAGIAALCAIPPLVLLYFLKLRRKPAPISSTLLWRKAIEDLQVNSPFQRLRRNLLLLLQLLLLCALLFALARPISFAFAKPAASTVILIDRSASMATKDESGTRLDAAKQRAKNLVDALPRDGRGMVVAFDSSGEVLQPFTSDRQSLRSAIDSITVTDRTTRLKMAYQMADAAMNYDVNNLREGNEVPADVFVLSDGRISDAGELVIASNVKYEKFGKSDTDNLGIVSMSAKRNYEAPTQVQVFVRLANYGQNVKKSDVQLSVSSIDPAEPDKDNFQVRSVQSSVTVMPDRWTDEQRKAFIDSGGEPRPSVEFSLELTAGAVIRVQQMSADALSADDIAQVVVPPPKTLSAILVTPGNVYLEKLMPVLNLGSIKTLRPAEYAANIPSDADVIIFDRYSPEKLPEAGSFIYFDALGPNMPITPLKNAQGLPLSLETPEVLDWKRDHPILRTLNMGKLYIESARALQPTLEAEVLVESSKGPLIVLARRGLNTHLVVAFDVLNSNWPLRESWPIFMVDAMQYLALGASMNVNESFTPGATPSVPRTALARLGTPLPKSLDLVGPAGQRQLNVPAAADFALPPLNQVGLYRTQPAVPGFERFAVNLLSESESNTLPIESPPGNIGATVASGGGRAQLEWWWYLIAAVGLPLLLIEWWVYTRRVHL